MSLATRVTQRGRPLRVHWRKGEREIIYIYIETRHVRVSGDCFTCDANANRVAAVWCSCFNARNKAIPVPLLPVSWTKPNAPVCLPLIPSPVARPHSLALRISDIVEQGASRLEHPCKVLVKSSSVHVGRLAESACRWVVNNRGEFSVLEAFNELSHVL